MTDDRSRRALQHRLGDEFGDADIAARITAAIADDTIDRLVERTGGDIAGSDLLSYRAPRIVADRVDSLWVLAFGYRLATHRAPIQAGEIPPMTELEPGPVNEALAHAAAAFVADHPVPVVAQWEVARVLHDLGITDAISVEPDQASDGSIVYLSTAGVIDKGLRLAREAGVGIGFAGVIGHADHARRCVLTATAAGLDAAVPDGIRLPPDYDPESGQPWTRSRVDFIPVDLLARSLTA
ncbi:MAG: hypothetical protein R2707_17710 [Acidimicrobiales bacterium]